MNNHDHDGIEWMILGLFMFIGLLFASATCDGGRLDDQEDAIVALQTQVAARR